MKDFEKIKNEYQSINAPDELKLKVKKIIKKEKSVTKIITKTLIGAGGVAAAFALAFNFVPNLAHAANDIPVLSSIVKVVTFGRYESKDNGYEAKVATPKIEGLLDKELEDKLNNEFKENSKALISAYEKDVKALKKQFGDETVHMGIDSDYTVKTDNDDILALDVYILYTAGSSSTKHTYYNINKKTGSLITLSSLFKKNADYITPISKYIKQEMIRRNNEENGMFWTEDGEFTEGFEKIKKQHNFYINDSGNIVICFDKYEVAAGAQGCPEFEIPKAAVKNILR